MDVSRALSQGPCKNAGARASILVRHRRAKRRMIGNPPWSGYQALLCFTHQSDVVTSAVLQASVLGPLAALLSLVTEQITLRISRAVCGLLSATLWKTVELVVHAIALGKCDLDPSRVPFSVTFPVILCSF